VHVSVLLREVLDLLAPREGALVLDGTLGAGGHAAALLERAGPSGRLLGLDRDPSALEIARAKLDARATLVHAPFDEAANVAARLSLSNFDAILLDLGVSSMQLDQAGRGFTFQQEGPLDMRMDPSGETTASSIVNEAEEEDLADLIWRLGEERFSRRIAREIVRARKSAPIATTRALAEIIERVVPRAPRKKSGKKPIHPATRTFQALRIAVNEELSRLERALPLLLGLLKPKGRLAVISFHSLEDRPVKQLFREWKSEGLVAPLTKKPLVASDDEIAGNPRARSAKLRAVEKR
jgi:16S rRNA (cytosine1402-N4)-methyltransferase